MNFLCRFLIFAFAALLWVVPAQAQFEIRGKTTNRLDPRWAGGQATVSGGALTGISVRSPGKGYTAPPTVTIAAPASGVTARATATLGAGGVVSGFVITQGGSGYSASNPPAVFVSPPVNPSGTTTNTPQFAGQAITSATAGAVAIGTGVTSGRYPSARDTTVPESPQVTAILRHASSGNSFASGVPRYFMGDEIERPTVRWDGTSVAQTYWRARPVEATETFSATYLGEAGEQIALPATGTVQVTQSATDSSEVTVTSVPAKLTAGATLLGQRVNLINGNTVILAGNANRNIGGSTGVSFTPYQPYYFSPHANKVFATQPGRVTITWVSSVPDTTKPGESTPTYKFRREIFAVSSAARVPTRTIYWTESAKGFDGPPVSIPTGRITRVNPIHNSFVPGMTEEYVPVGNNPNPGTALPPELRTIWYDEQSGNLAFLHAYNIEGRIFIEYLGAEKPGRTGLHEFLGADIVDIRRVAETEVIETKLGEKLRPRPGPALNGDDQLKPIAQAGFIAEVGTFVRPDGISDHYAEQESLDPDQINLFWLETKDAGIHFLPPPSAPLLSIDWPKFRRSYLQVWPSEISDYQPVNVPAGGNSETTGPNFAPTSLPTIAFQDDETTPLEASIDGITQRFIVEFDETSTDNINRSLLKFTSTDGLWYVRLWSQSQDALGTPAVADNPGTPNIDESQPAVYTLNDLNADGIRDWSGASMPAPGEPGGQVAATVGARLEPPAAGFALAGHVSSGTAYAASAYVDPLAAGFQAAAMGAIIPVNAQPTNDDLVVWWFKKVFPPNDKIEPFYVPAVAAHYHISYPQGAQTLVIASGKGVENPGLTSAQASGSIYVQNNPFEVGYNPNEEHALMLAGNAYALRDDLNVTTGDQADYSSEPFVLIQYNELGTGRPAMRVLQVVREDGTYPLTYDKVAGTPVQPPMPLTALPLPLKDDGKVMNFEVQGTPDPAAGEGSPGYYDSFTFEDRKGQHWIYRGPHDGAAPDFGMKFFYYLREGFYFPALGLSGQPEVGSIQPFIADLGGNTPVTLTFSPKWPDDPTLATPAVLGEMKTAQTLTLAKGGLPQVRGQSSVQVLYQQSVANNGSTADSVILHDPTRAKTFALGSVPGGLDRLPDSVLTTGYKGKTWFQKLPPSLQNRFYFDPDLGAGGALVMIGEFIDEAAGEDYLNLNALSESDVSALKALCPSGDITNKASWDNAVDGLSTDMETFRKYAPAIATPVLSRTAEAIALMAAGTIESFVVTDAGMGYTLPPSVSVDQPADSQAGLFTGSSTAATSVDNGSVASITLIESALYAEGETPSVTIAPPPSPGGILSLTIADGGRGYEQPPAVTISPPPAGGTQATAVAEINGGSVTNLRITNPGFGYSPDDLPQINIAPPRLQFAVDSTTTIGARDLCEVTSPDDAVDSYALSSTGNGSGYVTLVTNNGEVFTDPGNPVSLQIIRVVPELYQGDLKVLLASNPLDEQVTLRHSGDYGGEAANFEFEWRYGYPDNGLPPSGDPSTDPAWLTPDGTLGSSVLVGGSPQAVISTPAVLMADTYFTMRYQKAGDSSYSDWTSPQLVEGWIKRVLGKITPFNQRMTDLYNASINTDVSLLTQAGGRWEGDIALNLDNINDAGLIEIYETVLNRGKSFTVGSGIDFEPANNALILAAGYLNDLYVILGNEAYADAANPTISIDDQTTVTEVNTSRFSFEGQVTSSLEEELALLKGRDDFGLPSVSLAPAYNRLFWNYTRGINSGEVMYAVNYNIREVAGSTTENGILDAADAQRMFPQGHGDAYGHYLTALKGYYKLLTHPEFTWTPSAEAVSVLGQPVLVDYKDERKFIASAASVARTAQQVLSLVHRQTYKDDPNAGWSHFQDGKVNTNRTPNTVRHQGFDEWACRSGQGSFLHWVTGNALLPDKDTDPSHTGVQIVDRTTVPELDELAAASVSFQTTMDLANDHLNPLGLSTGAIAFDISPAEHKAGHSHYEQVYDRALNSLLNARGSFDQAAKMTRLLRNQNNQISDQQQAIFDQERAYVKQLIEIYGQPYAGDIGPGKTYEQGYAGPDLEQWFIIDQPTDLVDTASPVTISVRVPTRVRGFSGNAIDDIKNSYGSADTVEKSLTINPNRFVQFSGVIDASGELGRRPELGALQQALLDSYLARVSAQEAAQNYLVMVKKFKKEADLFDEMIRTHVESIDAQITESKTINGLLTASATLKDVAGALFETANQAELLANAGMEAFPKSVGLANDPSFAGRFATLVTAVATTTGIKVAGGGALLSAGVLDVSAAVVERELFLTLDALAFGQEQLQAAYEFEQTYRELVSQHYQLAAVMAGVQSADQRIANLSASGQRLLLERESFRKRAAAVIAGYRTKDLTFRTFRNEALEQYRTLFDLAARYSYLTAKSYDYETGLLGSREGQEVINRLVASRSLGDLTGGVPQATTSTLGDAGLAGTLAQMNADFAVAEGRLGINNPDQTGTLFSLRHELYRILDDPGSTSDDDAWQQTLEQHILPDLLADPDVVAHCNSIRKPDGSPVPGLLISFRSSIDHVNNFFGLPGAPGDHAYTPSNFATKISSAGIVLEGYVGMDPFTIGTPGAGTPNSANPDALRATPYVYLIPCGNDLMYAPPLGDTNTIRSWKVNDQALPLPYNLGASDFNETQFFSADGTLSEQPWILRKHPAFRPVNDPAFFFSRIPQEFTNSRLVGRSVWNSKWKLVIPAYTLLSDEYEGLDRFVRSVKDIQIFLRTYSYSGN